MKYGKTVKGKFISRPNRFIAYVEILKEGEKKEETEVVQSHVKNTGRLRELLIPGATVYLEDFGDKMGKRKLRYSLIGVEKIGEDGKIRKINIDSQAPNRVAAEALEAGKIQLTGMECLSRVKSEKTWEDSRFDFYAEGERGEKGWIEVKGVTLEKGNIAFFPDAPTERGIKHIHGLMKTVEAGYKAYIIFVIQMAEIEEFHPNEETHPAFGEALRQAKKKGVEILAYSCHVERDRLEIQNPVPVKL